MDDPDKTDEESVSGPKLTTSDSGGSTRDIAPMSIIAALQKLHKPWSY